MNTSSAPLDQDPPDDDVLAGEYVLGVLDGAQRRDVEQRIAAEPAFAAEVTHWETQLMLLAQQIAPVPVPAYVWARIGSALGFGAPARKVVVAERSPFWNNVGVWRWLGVGGFATAAVCALALLNVVRVPETSPSPQPPSVAVAPVVAPMPMATTLARDDGKPGFVASVDQRSGRMTITPLDPVVQAGRVQELWLIPADGTPRSLGIVSAERAQAGQVPEKWLALLEAGAIFAITLEPPGGGPGGNPSGPVTAKGAIAFL
ncbi:MAG: anti-sigma factor [Pseudoxanthomonas sp.]